MSTFDAVWLAEYLRTHPAEAARMALSETRGAPRPPEPGAPAVGLEVAAEPEGVFMERLRHLAVEDLHYLGYHTFSSKRSTPGFPDWALVRPAEDLQPDEPSMLYLLELKGTRGVVSPAQQRWLAALSRVTAVHAQALWPCDWAHIATLLTRRSL